MAKNQHKDSIYESEDTAPAWWFRVMGIPSVLAETYAAACAKERVNLKILHSALQRNDPWAISTFDSINFRSKIADVLRTHYPSPTDEKLALLFQFVTQNFQLSPESLVAFNSLADDTKRIDMMSDEEQAALAIALDKEKVAFEACLEAVKAGSEVNSLSPEGSALLFAASQVGHFRAQRFVKKFPERFLQLHLELEKAIRESPLPSEFCLQVDYYRNNHVVLQGMQN